LTLLTPAIVRMSPFFSVDAPEAQPSMSTVDPVCPAPLMSGVDAVNVPEVCVGRTGSCSHFPTPS
jgi:hypothetical protein